MTTFTDASAAAPKHVDVPADTTAIQPSQVGEKIDPFSDDDLTFTDGATFSDGTTFTD